MHLLLFFEKHVFLLQEGMVFCVTAPCCVQLLTDFYEHFTQHVFLKYKKKGIFFCFQILRFKCIFYRKKHIFLLPEGIVFCVTSLLGLVLNRFGRKFQRICRFDFFLQISGLNCLFCRKTYNKFIFCFFKYCILQEFSSLCSICFFQNTQDILTKDFVHASTK